MKRPSLKQMLEGSKSIRIGSTVHLFAGTPEEVAEALKIARKEARKAMLRGLTVEEDGVKTWLEDWEVHPPVFHDDGSRTVHVRKLVTKTADGKITRKTEKTFFRNPENAL